MMKTIATLSVLILFVFFNCTPNQEIYVFSTFREPATEGLYLAWSDDGYVWHDLGGPWLKPQAGVQKVMRDPSIVRGPDGIFRMVWTSSWTGDRGFGYAESEDLIHWSEQKHIPVMEYDTSTVNVWAPELFYDAIEDQYIIVWASTIPFRFPKGEEEERNNHRLYCTTTRNFINFSETRLFLDPGFSVIDAVIVFRDTGDYVLVMKDNTRPNRNLRAGFGTSPLGPFTAITDTFTHFCTEGPTVLKTGNEWLIFYDAYREKKYGAVSTTDFRHFTDVSSQIRLPEGHKHGTVFTADRRILRKILKESESRKNIISETEK
jgi:hypothetical protein